jgi:methylmalonyl-CoA mutase
MLDFADIIAINKFDKKGSEDALRDVRKQYKRNHELWEQMDGELPVIGTIASQFNDEGMNRLYKKTVRLIEAKIKKTLGEEKNIPVNPHTQTIIPSQRIRYLAEISDSHKKKQFVY